MVPCLGGAFVLHGVARAASPASPVICTATTPRRPSRFASVVLRLRGTALTPTWAPTETAWPPRFLGNPVVRLPCSHQTPVGPPRLAFEDDPVAGSCRFRRLSPLPVPHSAPLSLSLRLAARRCRPRTMERRGPLTTISLSRLNHTAFALAVYASQLSSSRRNCTATQDSLPTVGQTLPGGIGYPQGYFARFQSAGLHDFLLTQASPGAIQVGMSVHKGRLGRAATVRRRTSPRG